MMATMSLVLFFLFCLYSLPCSLAASADDWRGRSIYQLVVDRYALGDDAPTICLPGTLTWCGGDWNSVRKNLDYIQRAGFTAIWISPVSQNYEGPMTQYGDPYHGYWVADATQLNGRFGSSDDLKALSLELHKRGMYLMVDIIINDVMATSTTPDLSTYMFKNETQYHPYCAIEWGNATSEEICWLGDTIVPLVDINTEDPSVVSVFQAWIKSLVQEYSIDGLLINAAKHVNMDFLPGFCAEAGVFCLGEVDDLDIDKVSMYQGPHALDSVLHYPMYGALVDTFAIPGQQNMSSLADMITQSQQKFEDCGLLGNFMENLNVARWRNLSVDTQSFDNAIIFTLMSDGIPIVYYGQEQGFNGGLDPYNREPLWSSGYANSTEYLFVSRLNEFRNFLVKKTDWVSSSMQVLTSTADGIAFIKGPVVTVLTNIGSPSKETATPVYTPYPSETPLINILDCKQWPVGSNGTIDVSYVRGGVAVVLIPMNDIEDSGLCGTTTDTSKNSSSNAHKTSGSLASQPLPPFGARGLLLTSSFALTVNWLFVYFLVT